MADIFPTGYFAALNAFKGLEKESIRNSTVLLIGCGPVGLCAILNALDFNPKHLIAIDSVESRLQIASKLGAEAINYQQDMEGLHRKVDEYTAGRGVDIVIESVGHSDALGGFASRNYGQSLTEHR
jgi:threonine dehydrogenase-like Zn-dependent dehydrogenase